MSLRKAMWRGGLFGSQFYPNGNGPWRGGLWASQRAGGGGTDWSQVSIGDEVEGGIYAGEIEYGDGRRFHIISAKASGEDTTGLKWGNYTIVTGADDPDDGAANQDLILNSFDSGDCEVFYHCRDYAAGGHNDWYPPAPNELDLVQTNLAGHAEFSDNTGSGDWTFTSRELTSQSAAIQRFSDGATNSWSKNGGGPRVRPIRRVPV